MAECQAELSPAHQDLMLVSGMESSELWSTQCTINFCFWHREARDVEFCRYGLKERGCNDNAE